MILIAPAVAGSVTTNRRAGPPFSGATHWILSATHWGAGSSTNGVPPRFNLSSGMGHMGSNASARSSSSAHGGSDAEERADMWLYSWVAASGRTMHGELRVGLAFAYSAATGPVGNASSLVELEMAIGLWDNTTGRMIAPPWSASNYDWHVSLSGSNLTAGGIRNTNVTFDLNATLVAGHTYAVGLSIWESVYADAWGAGATAASRMDLGAPHHHFRLALSI